jgi:type I restriction enzyme M protein
MKLYNLGKSTPFELDEPSVATILAKLLNIGSDGLDIQFRMHVEESIFQIDLLTQAQNVFAITIFCPAHNFDVLEEHLKAALERTLTAGIGILADPATEEKRCLRRRFDRSVFEYIPYFQFDISRSGGDVSKICMNSDSSSHRSLTPLLERVEDVFFEIHSHFRDIDGLHADEALDELCKVIYAKLYDEEQTPSGKPYRMQCGGYLNSEECAADIRALYFDAAEYDSRIFGVKIPEYSRSRGVFTSQIRLSSTALLKGVEALQGYHIGNSAFDVKGRAFQRVIGPTMRSGMGQYFTPDPVVRFLSRVMNPDVRELILDPFCGSGHFLTASLDLVRSKHYVEDKTFHEFAFGKLHGIEKSDRMVRIAMTDMRLHGDGHSNIRCTDALLAFSNYPDIKPGSFDVILTNPPFGSVLASDSIKQLGEFELAEGKKKVPLEVLGLERCIQFLRPGGRMGIILPDGIVANRNTKYVRDWLAQHAKIRGIISLPLETFTPFGASIKTTILILRKWLSREEALSDYPVFLARVDSVGYDATGKAKGFADLEEGAIEFQSFIDQEGW